MQRMKPFRKRNPLPIGAASLAILLLLTAASLNIRDLPLIGQGPTYSARFSESAGVQPDDDVRIAGIRIGTVTDLELDGKDVVISFKAPDAWVGDRTSASIEIKTVLGQKYINLEPAGEAPLDPDASIPRERTRAPFDVIQAFSQLSTTVEDLDTDQLGQSLGVLSETLDGAAGPVRGALDGLSRLSRTISSRDQELARLLANTRTTTQVLADRDAEVERLINDGNLLLGELRARKAAIDNLLTGTIALSQQLRGLVADNEATLRPTLEQLDGVLSTLEENSANLENGLRLLAPFARVFANVVGNGRWFDAYICNLDPPGDQNCDPGSSLDPASLAGLFNPALLQQILQNALAQILGPVDLTNLPAVISGLSPAQLAQFQALLGGGLTPQQLQILFPNGVPDVNALTQALAPGAGGGLLPGAGTPPGGAGGEGGGN
ncbi:MCE family protein [Actinomycetospora callitridis]|uniref:MCE family protein n=1 Tax=Actinomycetospora callitridis TaxID=913944 RepID=UPI0030823940